MKVSSPICVCPISLIAPILDILCILENGDFIPWFLSQTMHLLFLHIPLILKGRTSHQICC